MADQPLLAIVETEQFGTGHEKHSPAHPPLLRALAPVYVCEDGPDLVLAGIHVCQPGITGLLVMCAVPVPALHQFQMFLEVQRQSIAGHDATREEITGHPVVIAIIFKRVGCTMMSKDVFEKATTEAKCGGKN